MGKSTTNHEVRGLVGSRLFLALLLWACGEAPIPELPVLPVPETFVSLVDSTQELAVAGRNGWNHIQTASADLDGDGKTERIVMTVRVEMMRGQPLWDDGQPWQVYVESDTNRTYLYARYVQLGTLTVRVTAPESARRPAIIILEQLPDRLAVYEVGYHGVGQFRVTTAYEKMLDSRGDVSATATP